MPSLADGLVRLLAVLDRMEIPYQIGGSVASTAHGVYRSTNDVDLVAKIEANQVNELAESLQQSQFYADEDMIGRALRVGRAFNVIFIPTAYKYDIFPAKDDLYSRTEFARRCYQSVTVLGPDPIECALASPEDTILRKLNWYRLGGGANLQQWRDAAGVIAVKGDSLDYDYLRKWAAHLKVDDLLDKLLPETAR